MQMQHPISRAAKDIRAQMKLGLSCDVHHFQKPKWKVILSEHAEEGNDPDVITLIMFCEPLC